MLALDASTPRCAVAAGDAALGTYRAGQALTDGPQQASAQLVPTAQAVLAAAAIDASALSLVACGRGPGTFTGTRVAVATAMGLALGAGCSIVELSTLAAVAASAGVDGTVLALLDARRGEVYGAAFEVDIAAQTVVARSPEWCAPIASVLAEVDSFAAAVGPGVEPYRAALPAANAIAMPGPTPEGLWIAAVAAWRRGAVVAPAQLRAVYLRESYAEMGVNPPKNPVRRSPFV